MDEKDDSLDMFKIPQNYKVKGKWKQFYIRNIVEALIFTFLFVSTIFGTRLIVQIKIGLALTIGIVTFTICLFGIKNTSAATFVARYLTYLYANRNYHLKGVTEIYGKTDTNRTVRKASLKEYWNKPRVTEGTAIDRIKNAFRNTFDKDEDDAKKEEKSSDK